MVKYMYIKNKESKYILPIKIFSAFLTLLIIISAGLINCYAQEIPDITDSSVITDNITDGDSTQSTITVNVVDDNDYLTDESTNISPYYFPAIDYVEVINNGNGSYTLTIYPEGDFSYSFDGGITWQKSNTATIYTN